MDSKAEQKPRKSTTKYSLEQRLNIVDIFKKNNNSYSVTQRICRQLYGPDMVPQYNTIKKYVQRFDATGTVADMTPRYELVFEWELTAEDRKWQMERARRQKLNKQARLARKQAMENAAIVHAIQNAASISFNQTYDVHGDNAN